jgi:hypothetical protein
VRILFAIPVVLALASCSKTDRELPRVPGRPSADEQSRPPAPDVKLVARRATLMGVLDEFVSDEEERAGWRQSLERGELDEFTPESLRAALETTQPLSGAPSAPGAGSRDLEQKRKDAAAAIERARARLREIEENAGR